MQYKNKNNEKEKTTKYFDIISSKWSLPILFKEINNIPFNIFHIIPYYETNKFSVYGSPCFKWNSGRTGELNLSLDFIKSNIKNFNSISISCYLTFSSYWIKEQDLSNELGNNILTILNTYNINSINGAILSSDLLTSYIRSNFPNLKLKCSLIKSVYENSNHDINWYNKMLDLYDIVVAHVDCPIDVLRKIKDFDKDRIEILVNEDCIKNCPNRKICYKEQKDFSLKRSDYCIKYSSSNIESCRLTKNEVQRLCDMGFKRFKLQGRETISI